MLKEEFISLYKNNNKTGKFSKIDYIKKNIPEIYLDIINYSTVYSLLTINFKQQVYHYVNNIEKLPRCKECGSDVIFINSTQGYRTFCSERCSTLNDDTKIKLKKTNLIKYGVDHPKQSSIVKEKYENTCLEKYGVEHASKSLDFKEKYKNTCLEKYGVENFFKSDSFKEKSKTTFLEKYGVEHALQHNEFKTKQQKTSFIKYGGNYNNSEEFKNKHKLLFINKFKNIINIISINDNNECECNCDCGGEHTFVVPKYVIYNRILSGLKICNICNPTYYVSGGQIEIKEFIENYISNVLLSYRKIIKGELDIYLPDLKLAFEFNGLWWHSELYKDKNYHLNKTEDCEANGIQLIHIWEDEWIHKQDIIKSMILNKIGKTPNRIFARKCEIVIIEDNKISKDFLIENHIQGNINSKIKIGLVYNKEIVSLMTFGNRRISLGKKNTKDNEYELLRFCNKLNTNVVGGASRLFKYFLNNYNPDKIITYADRSFSQGKLYKTLGFEFEFKTKPNYYYIFDKVKKHRFNFRKNILIKKGYDLNKTEHEIMLERKIYRIYNSGNLKFSYQNFIRS